MRLGPAIDHHPQAPRVSGTGVEAGRRSGGARRPPRLDAQDRRPLSIADEERRAGHHAAGRFRRAVAICARSHGSTRSGWSARRSRRESARPRPYGLHHRSGRRHESLSGRDCARRAGARSRRAHYFERSEQIPTLVRLAVGEIVDAERAAHGGLAGSSSSICPRRAGGGSRRTFLRATRRRASSRTASRRTTRGPRPRLAPPRPKRTN